MMKPEKRPLSKTVDHLLPGSIWTMGPNKRYRDYSWTGDIWEVVAISGNAVFLRKRWPHPHATPLISVLFEEHDWFPAEIALTEVRRHEAEIESEASTSRAETRQRGLVT